MLAVPDFVSVRLQAAYRCHLAFAEVYPLIVDSFSSFVINSTSFIGPKGKDDAWYLSSFWNCYRSSYLADCCHPAHLVLNRFQITIIIII